MGNYKKIRENKNSAQMLKYNTGKDFTCFCFQLFYWLKSSFGSLLIKHLQRL